MQQPFPSSAAIELAITQLLTLASVRGPAIRKIEYIAPSEPWCKTLALVVFYETDADLKAANENGNAGWFRTAFPEQLKFSAAVLPFGQMPEEIRYEFDSHETVLRDYNGSYFLRLR